MFSRNVLKIAIFRSLMKLIFMAYISKHHLVTARIIKVHKILFSCYGGHTMPDMNNVNFPENKFTPLIMHTLKTSLESEKSVK